MVAILSDGHASIEALTGSTVYVQVVCDCMQTLNALAKHNRVSLEWVPGHRRISGYENADSLPRKGSQSPFTSPEPAVGLPRTTVRAAINRWVRSQITKRCIAMVTY